MFEVGTIFKHAHAAGVTEYRVHSPHRDFGYWNCVSVSEPEIHKALRGSFHTFHRDCILKALGKESAVEWWKSADQDNIHGLTEDETRTTAARQQIGELVDMLTQEQERRVIESITETQRQIDREMSYSTQFRKNEFIAECECHMEKLIKMLSVESEAA